MESIPQLTASESSVVVEIGNTAIAFDADDASFTQLLTERYCHFVTPHRSVHSQFNVEIIEPCGDVGPDEDLRVKTKGDHRWIVERGDFQAEWNSETGRGFIRQSLNPYSADAVLRVIHSLILARQGGFLLHSASATLDGDAFLFSGVSGAGKTTISRLAPLDSTILTDEISYIRPEVAGYRAFGTPFAGELSKPGENVSAPLSALYFLEKGLRNRIEAVPSDEALRRLLRNILFFARDTALVDLVFQAACHFVERVPVRRLIFAPDEQVWETIRSAAN